MVYQIIWTLLATILILGIVYNLTKIRKSYEYRIANKCKNDDIITNANIVSMERGYASMKSKISEFIVDYISVTIGDITHKIEYAQLQVINRETLEKLEKEVSEKIEKEMSTAFINTLTLVYSKQELSNVIGEKIKQLCETWASNTNINTQQAVSEEKNKYTINAN